MSIGEMIAAHPHVDGHLNDPLADAVAKCFDCVQICTSCADACQGEKNAADLVDCVRLDLDCADVCAATGRVAIRRTGSNEPVIRAMLDACVTATARCAEMCEGHAEMMEHCRLCAEACRACEEACKQALSSMT